jgi:hypothetical protein
MTGAEVVDGLGHDLLAYTRFAEQEDRGGCGRNLFNLLQYLLDGKALTDNGTSSTFYLSGKSAIVRIGGGQYLSDAR